MSKGLFTALSGAMAQSARLDTVANNIANANTTAFKRDTQVFKEYLTSLNREPGPTEAPRISDTVESYFNFNGGDSTPVEVEGTYADFSQGAIRPTGNPLDLALDGDAFFEVATPEGVKLTRTGNFTIDGDGRLITKQGYPVQREGGGEFRFTSTAISVSENGEIFDGAENLGRLSLVTVEKKTALQKQGANLYTLKENFNEPIIASPQVRVQQAALESSNVNLIREMTDMITATRTFETAQKAIQAYDQMASKVVNEVPKLNQG